jgi:hypothetical protein
LTQLEDRLFEHNYPNENEATRLHRLEQFVFGDDQTGSLNDRVSRLQSTLAKNEPKTPELNAQQTSLPAQPKQEVAQTVPNDQSATSFPKFDYGSYPRVTELEKHFLGKTYVNDALPERVARLETKAFGKASPSDDLGQRVDNLDQYAHRHDLFKERSIAPQVASDPQYMSQAPDVVAAAPPPNPFAPGNQMASGTAQRTTIMEQAVFGHSYPNRPLDERIARLEKKIVPYEHNLSAKNLPSRVDNLWSILSAANNLNNNSPLSPGNRNSVIGAAPLNQPSGGAAEANESTSTGTSTSSDQPVQPGGGHQSWLHKLSKMMSAPSTNTGDSGYYRPPNSYGSMVGTGNWYP